MVEAIINSFTLNLETVGKLSDLSQRLVRKKSDLVREAIGDLFVKYQEVEYPDFEGERRSPRPEAPRPEARRPAVIQG